MDPPRDRAAGPAADEKPRRRGSGTGSKKSTRRKAPSLSSSLLAGPGGERAQAHGTDPRGDGTTSGGGVAARADLVTHRDPGGDSAQRKDYPRSGEPASGGRTRAGAKGVRRGSGRADVGGGEDRVWSDRGERVRTQREQSAAADGLVGGAGGGTGSSVDRAILQK